MAYYFKPSALRDLKKLPRPVQRRIVQKLDFYIAVADPLEFARPLSDRRYGEYRFRVGDYRIIFDFDKKRQAIIVLAVGDRKDIYK